MFYLHSLSKIAYFLKLLGLISKVIEKNPVEIMSGNSSSNATNKRSRVTNTRFADFISVLHVDDEEAFLKATKIYLEEIGEGKLTIDSIVNPERVLGKLQEKRYDVIVADYRMIPIDGLDLLKQLRDKNDKIPFIIFTGRGREEVAIKSLNLGANRYIKKGMDTESQYRELFHAIREVVHHSRVRDALQESEERYRVIFNESPISLWEEDFSVVKRYFNEIRAQGVEDLRQHLDNNPHEVEKLAQMVKIINVNNTTLKMYKAKDKTEFHKGLSAFLSEEASYQFKEELVALFNGKTEYQNEFPGYKLTGEKFDIIVRLSVIPGYEETLEKIIVSIIDITERKQAEKKIRQSESRWRQLVQNVPTFIAEMDVNGKITSLNKTQSGFSLEDYIGKSVFDVTLPEGLELLKSAFSSVLKQKAPVAYEAPDYGPNKTRAWYHHFLSPVKTGNKITSLIIAVTDITSIKDAETRVRESEERLRLFMDSATENFSLWDSELNIIDNNAVSMSWYPGGTKKEDIMGKNMLQFSPGLKKTGRYNKYMEVIKTGKPFSINDVVVHPNYGERIVNVMAFKVGDGMGLIVRDVTEQKKIEEKLKNKLEMEQLLSEISSEFINLPSDQIDNTITNTLKKISQFIGVNRSSLFLLSEDQAIATNTHEWCARPEDSQIKQLQGISFETFGYYAKILLNHEIVNITRLDDLPPDAHGEREWIQQYGFRSLLFIPLLHEGKLYGTLGFYGDVDKEIFWPEDFIELLKFLGNLFLNILERKRTEEQLRESEEKYRNLLVNLSDTVIEIDSEGNFTYLSPQGFDLFGYRPEEAIGKNAFEFAHPNDLEMTMEKMTEALEGKYVFNFEYRGRHKDGHYIPVSASGRMIKEDDDFKIISVLRDITERKRTEEALRESEERFRLLGENVAVGLSIIQEDQLVYGNDSFFEIIGFPREEILYVKISEFNKKHVHPEDLAFIQTQLQKKISDEKVGLIPRYQYRWISGDNQLKWIEVNSKSIIFQGKTAILGAIIDITRQKQAENDLRLVNEELQNFSSIVAHDLKAPLRNIRTVADWLLRDFTDDLNEEGKDHLASLVKQTTHMDALIDGIYQYSKIDHIQKKIDQINLNEFLPEIVDVLSPPDDIKVTIQTELPILFIDRTHITQIFSNLIDNAIKYMDKPKGHITISYEDKKNFEQFSVMDNGPGIEESHFKRIFQIFQTLTPLNEAKGTGVGLAIVKKVVEMNGGKVWLESTVGKGSTFYFTLPKH